MFKLFILFLFISYGYAFTPRKLVQISSDHKEKLQAAIGHCIPETGVESNIVEKFKKGDFPINDNVQNFFYCVLKNTPFVNKDGYWNIKNIIDMLPDNLDKQMLQGYIEECNEKAKGSAAEVCYKVMLCYQTKTLLLVDV